jgi:hypothetical protein
VADDGTFAAQRQAIIDGLDSAQSEATGWNAEVRDKEVVGAVVRTSDTVVTITLTAAAAYDITADETITVTIPAAALVTSAGALEADETFLISAAGGGGGEAIIATLSSSFSSSVSDFTVYVSKFIALVTSFAASASAGSLPAAISATLAWSVDLTASASSVLQRIATASLRTTFSLLGSASGVPSAIVSGATDIVVSSVNFIRTGATFITGSMRNIFRKD